MADIALKTSLPGTGSIFDAGLNVPEDPLARGRLGVSALNGVEADIETAFRTVFNKTSISDVYGLVVAQGIDALIERLAQSGIARDTARTSLDTIDSLVSKAASYPLFPTNSIKQFYVTEAGDILTHPNDEPLAKTADKIDRLQEFALALTSLAKDPIEGLPVKTRERLLGSLQALKAEVLTPRTEGQHEVKESTPSLEIPNAPTGWVSDAIEIGASGRLEKFKLDLDLEHSYIGALTVELVAPDRTSIKLHDQSGEGATSIKKTFTLESEGMRALEGKEINGRWRIRILDNDGYNDTGKLKSWKLDVTSRGGTGSAETYGEAKKKALYAGAGAIGRRLATTGSADFKSRAFDFTADLVKTSPYGDIRSILLSGLNVTKSSLTAADQARFDKELVPLVAPETPDYDTIFRLKYNADGTYTAQKRSLNFVVMFGSEEDNLIYNGGKRMIEAQGFTKQESGKPGYELYVKKVNQNDPSAPCQELRTYVAQMNGNNMFAAMSDPDIDVIQYDGHSNLGRNIENSLKNAPELAGSKILALGACATTDRSFMLRQKWQDTKRVQLINTYESTYFNWEIENGRKYLNYSENLMLMFGMQEGMAKLKGWKGEGSLGDVLKHATDSWEHTKDINYTNPSHLEQLMLWDLDKNGMPDGIQLVWDGDRVKPDDVVASEFKATAPAVPWNRLEGSKIFETTQSLDTFGRYNPIMKAAYDVRTMRPGGFQDLGETGPLVSVSKAAGSRAWTITGNSWYSHSSVEALRFEAHYSFADAALRESTNPQVRRMSQAEKNIMKLMFAASSLKYDQGWADDRIWNASLEKHGFPQIDYSVFEAELSWEHNQPRDMLAGNFRNIPRLKEALGAEIVAALENVR
jgi:subtilisin-like proprotein convertase family protein